MKHFIKSTGRTAVVAIAMIFALTSLTAGSGSPVSGVEVCLESSTGKKVTATTDREGKYTFDDVSKGTYTIKVRCTSNECVSSPRDAASGQATGKAKASVQDFHFSCEVAAPSGEKSSSKGSRDAATGLATGKRQHKPIAITPEWSSVSSVTVEIDGSSCRGDISSVLK